MPFWMLISKIILVFISVLVQAKKVYAFNIDVAYTIFYISMVSPGEECRQHFMNSEIYLTISKYFPSGCQILEATPFCTVILTNVSQFRVVYLLIYKMFNSVKTTSTCHTKGKQKTKTSQWWWQVKRPADTDKRIILDNVYWVNRSVWSI